MNQVKYLSITEAAKFNNVTRQAIYVQIVKNRIPAVKTGKRWEISLDDLKKYKLSKYSRETSIFNGQLVYNPLIGEYSVTQTAKALKIPVQQVYYGIRSGKIKASRKSAAWVILSSEIEAYREKHLKKRKRAA